MNRMESPKNIAKSCVSTRRASISNIISKLIFTCKIEGKENKWVQIVTWINKKKDLYELILIKKLRKPYKS